MRGVRASYVSSTNLKSSGHEFSIINKNDVTILDETFGNLESSMISSGLCESIVADSPDRTEMSFNYGNKEELDIARSSGRRVWIHAAQTLLRLGGKWDPSWRQSNGCSQLHLLIAAFPPAKEDTSAYRHLISSALQAGLSASLKDSKGRNCLLLLCERMAVTSSDVCSDVEGILQELTRKSNPMNLNVSDNSGRNVTDLIAFAKENDNNSNNNSIIFKSCLTLVSHLIIDPETLEKNKSKNNLSINNQSEINNNLQNSINSSESNNIFMNESSLNFDDENDTGNSSDSSCDNLNQNKNVTPNIKLKYHDPNYSIDDISSDEDDNEINNKSNLKFSSKYNVKSPFLSPNGRNKSGKLTLDEISK